MGIETHKGTARFASIRTMLEADFRGWLLVMEVQPKKEQIQSILTEAESARAEQVNEEGRVVFNSPAHIVTGVVGGV